MAILKELYLEFIDSMDCKMCGAQRCSATSEEVAFCKKWQDFLDKKIEEKE